MSGMMHPKKIENLLSLSTKERYDYFIREVAQFEKIWTIGTDEGYVIFHDKEGEEILPIWPHRELAEKCIFKEHKEMGATPESILLDSFLKNCIPDMMSDGILFGVFYDDKREALAVGGKKLMQDIKVEVEEIWGE